MLNTIIYFAVSTIGIVVLAATDVIIPIVVGVVALVIGVVGGYLLKAYRSKQATLRTKQIIEDANTKANEIVKNAGREALEKQDALLNDARNEAKALRKEAEAECVGMKRSAQQEINENRNSLKDQKLRLDKLEVKLDTRQDEIDAKSKKVDQKLDTVEERIRSLEVQKSEINNIIKEQENKLLEIARLSEEEAKSIILKKVESGMENEIANAIKDGEEQIKSELERTAQSLLANAINQYASDVVNERAVTTVSIPNDEMKGRIIGKEGRNVKAIEQVLGIDLIIDDTPEAVVISCHNPIRREIARRVLEVLVVDGRIQSTRIEELAAKYTKEVDNIIREAGEKTIFDLGVGKVPPELVRLIGQLKFRHSYGQNALLHSIEVAHFSGKLAAELGLDERLAKRAGLLHDIGKAIDHEVDGNHIDLGIQIAKRFNESKEVINAIASHHGGTEMTNPISFLVSAADTISAGRPGARNESVENYLKRLTQLEDICKKHAGVDKAYALQAGREVRIMVNPSQINDSKAVLLAHDIRQAIEDTMTYPGTIKVVVIRETRALETAK
jgi:ribonuclease Y